MIYGIVVDKDMSHPQMPKHIENAKIAILTCPFDPPKSKTKHKVDTDSVEKFQTLRKQEQQYFDDMVQKCKDVGAKICAKISRVNSREIGQGWFGLRESLWNH